MLSGEPPAKRPRAGAAEVPAMKNPKFYRLRAHANPLAESFALREEAPASPSCVDWAALFPAIRQNPSRKVAWVDVGCGFGGLVASLAEHYPSEIVLGMEIRDKVSAAAQERIVEQQQQQQQMLLGNAAVIRANCMRCLLLLSRPALPANQPPSPDHFGWLAGSGQQRRQRSDPYRWHIDLTGGTGSVRVRHPGRWAVVHLHGLR
jgi:hypothetical protein